MFLPTKQDTTRGETCRRFPFCFLSASTPHDPPAGFSQNRRQDSGRQRRSGARQPRGMAALLSAGSCDHVCPELVLSHPGPSGGLILGFNAAAGRDDRFEMEEEEEEGGGGWVRGGVSLEICKVTPYGEISEQGHRLKCVKIDVKLFVLNAFFYLFLVCSKSPDSEAQGKLNKIICLPAERTTG